MAPIYSMEARKRFETLSRFDDSNFPTTQPANLDASLNRWEQEQLFEEDLRADLSMLRPNRQERLLGWSEYRTGGAGFRATTASAN